MAVNRRLLSGDELKGFLVSRLDALLHLMTLPAASDAVDEQAEEQTRIFTAAEVVAAIKGVFGSRLEEAEKLRQQKEEWYLAGRCWDCGGEIPGADEDEEGESIEVYCPACRERLLREGMLESFASKKEIRGWKQ